MSTYRKVAYSVNTLVHYIHRVKNETQNIHLIIEENLKN